MKELSSVLYVRVTNDVLKGLDNMAKTEEKKKPGTKVTRSDVARTILLRALKRKK